MWRTYFIRPTYNGRQCRPIPAVGFYAPDLNSAFSQARTRWMSAASWTCLGSKE